MNRRPAGVTFSAVILGIFDLLLLITGLVYVMVAFLFARTPSLATSAAANGAPPPPQSVLVGIIVFFALIALACAGWGLSTFIGLLRMRNWARISIIVIGVCVTLVSLFQVLVCVIMQVAITHGGLPQNANSATLATADPTAIRNIFLFGDFMFLGVAAIGLWWIIYFAKKSTRTAFQETAPQTVLSSTAQLNPTTPITDFSIAQPADTSQPVLAQPAVEPLPIAEKSGRPISMTIIAVLLLLGSVSLVFFCFLPYPQFLFGIKITGVTEYIALLAMAALNALAGIGLLRRIHFGWLLAVGMQILGLLNLLTFVSPQVRMRYFDMVNSISRASTPVMPGAAQASIQAFQQKLTVELMIPIFFLCGLFIVFTLVLLWRARWYYKSTE